MYANTETSPVKRKKVLFVGEYLTPSHVMRPLSLARHFKSLELDYDIEVALSGVPGWCDTSDIEIHPLPGPETEVLNKRVKNVIFPLYTAKEIDEMVEAEVDLITKLKPDLVISDFRNTLAISSQLAEVPLVSLNDFYWHEEYGVDPKIVPDTPISKIIGHKLARSLGGSLSPLVERWHVNQFNRIAKKYGLKKFKSLRNLYNFSSEQWLFDLPKVFPELDYSNQKTQFIGPLTWEVNVPTPRRISVMTDRSAICITLTSSGDDLKIKEILSEAKLFGLPIVVLTAGKFDIPEQPNVYVEKFVPFSVMLAKTRIFISTGGSSTVYPAIKAGVPVIGIPQNITHWYSMKRFGELRVGKIVPPEEVKKGYFKKVLQEILLSENYYASIKSYQSDLQDYDPYLKVKENIDRLLLLKEDSNQ